MFAGFMSNKSATDVALSPATPTSKARPWKYLGAEGECEEQKLTYFSTPSGQFHLGACFVAPPLLGGDESTYEKLKTALSIPLPAGSFLQIGLLAIPDVFSYVSNYTAKKMGAQGLLGLTVRKRAELIQSGVNGPLVARSGVIARDFSLVVTVKIPCKQNPGDAECKEADNLVCRVEESLRSAGISLSRLDTEGYLGILQRLHHMYETPKPELDPRMPVREQVFYPGDDILIKRNEIELNGGESFVRMMSVKQLPKRTGFGIVNLLIGDPKGGPNQITEPFWFVLTLHYPDQTSKKDAVRTKYGWISHQCFGPTANLFPLLWYKKQGFDDLVHEMDGASGGLIIEANLTLAIFGKTSNQLGRQTSSLQAYYSALGFELREDRRVMGPLWNAILPLNTTTDGIVDLHRFRTMMTSQAAVLAPIIGEWKGTGTNGTSLFLTRRGQPALFSLWDSSTGYNGILFGGTGGGKSFASQLLIHDELAEGTKVWTIDVGHSYFKLAKAKGGAFMSFNTESQTCLNPFTDVESIDEDMDIIKAMLAKMAAPEAGLDDYRLSALEEAIKATWSKSGPMSTVTGVAEWCIQHNDQRIRDIGQQLYPFTASGSYGRWFEGDNNLDLGNDFVVLELQELKDRPILQKVVLLQLMNRIASEMYRTVGRRKLLVIDEAWEMLNDPVMALAVEAFYRKVRKHKGSVLMVTQGIGDLYGSPNGRAILSNSNWQIITEQKSDSIKLAVESKQLTMDPYAMSMIYSLHVDKGHYSDLMIRRSDTDWGVVRFNPDRFMTVLFSTTDEERDDVIAEIDAGGDPIRVIEKFVASHP